MSAGLQVPFMDLRGQHEPLMPEFFAAFREVAEAGAFAGGPFVERFENQFAAFCRTKHAIGVSSGTDALWLSLLALGVGPGDEVITAPNAFISTAEAISLTGARPVFVDVDEATFTLDARQLEAAITLRTQAIVPVHLFGQIADMDPILSIARRHGTPVIEEACQAPGAEYKGRRAGSMGALGCFGFFPGNNLGAFGEAGAVVTEDAELCSKLQVLRDHGQAAKNFHSTIGWDAQMDGIQAAVLSVKLGRLLAANAARQSHAQLYNELLAGDERVTIPKVSPHNLHAWHIYSVQVNQGNRDDILREMAARGVKCGVHYPVPIHLQRAFSFLGKPRGSFPVTERLSRAFLSLPMFPELSPEQISSVVDALRHSLRS